MTTKRILIILNSIGFIVSLVWLVSAKSMESLYTSIAAMCALIALITIKSNNKEGKVNLTQKGGKGSTNYQSGRDININK